MANIFPKNEFVTTELPKNTTILPYIPTDNENNTVTVLPYIPTDGESITTTVLPYIPTNEEDSEVKMVESEMMDLNDEV